MQRHPTSYQLQGRFVLIKILPTRKIQTWKDGVLGGSLSFLAPLKLPANESGKYVRPIPNIINRVVPHNKIDVSIMHLVMNSKTAILDYSLSLEGGSHTFTKNEPLDMTSDALRHSENKIVKCLTGVHEDSVDPPKYVDLMLFAHFASWTSATRADENGTNKWMFPDIFFHVVIIDDTAEKFGSAYAFLDVPEDFDEVEASESLSVDIEDIALYAFKQKKSLPPNFNANDPVPPGETHPWDSDQDGVLSYYDETGIIGRYRRPWDDPSPVFLAGSYGDGGSNNQGVQNRNEWDGDGFRTSDYERAAITGTINLSVTPWSANEWGYTPP